VDNRNIKFCNDFTPNGEVTRVDLEKLQTLFTYAAFWAQERKLEDLATAIRYSQPVIGVWDDEQLVGFARATSDGIYRATIWDVVIHPDYRGSGLGRKLVQTVLAHPLVQKVERVYLMTTHQQQFYTRIGFQENTSTTMVLHQHAPKPSTGLTTPADIPLDTSLPQP
jgi:N-acetylglutamate synthase-like GNAT family acetyltransferase